MKLASNAQKLRRARLAKQIQDQGRSAPHLGAHADSDLTLTDLRAFPLREPASGQRYTVLRVQTRSGLAGYGETDSATSADLAKAREIILGKPATAFEVLRQSLLTIPNLQAAVNMALLDVVGRFVKAPVYQLLGGPTRFKVRVLAALDGTSDDDLLASLERLRTAGHRAFLAPIPPVRASNQGQAFVRAVVKRLERLRAASGDDLDFVLDASGALSPGDASTLASAIESSNVLWFDEPCPVSNLGAVRKISAESVTPLGFGRHLFRAGEFQELLREEAVDLLRPGISRNGISQIRKMAALAESYYVAVAPYHNGGPIGTAAALHVSASLPNFFIQQMPTPEAEADRSMRIELTGSALEKVENGYVNLPTEPGLGITLTEETLGKFMVPPE